MPNPNRMLDKSHLSIDLAEERGLIHRDYIAHCFRWSHVVKLLMRNHSYKGARIIDIGCGKDQPLPRLMYANKMTGFYYTGIDINNLIAHEMLAKAHSNRKILTQLIQNQDASLLDPERLKWGKGNYLVCFEVLEHMHPVIMGRMLKHWHNLLNDDAIVFVSTPVYNGSAAANHINEMSRETLMAAFGHHKWEIVANYGTFASISDLQKVMSDSDIELLNELRNYYDTNVLATIFAPKYPKASRNNLWVLKKSEFAYLATMGEDQHEEIGAAFF